MKIKREIDVPDVADCWNGGGLPCDHLDTPRMGREYFKCNEYDRPLPFGDGSGCD